jgi:RHH-type proline utilization regulon transcriptional repressor/proline dehydrogenase/delta 1-pyrroline-5-carboxylate dehydrogenase
MKVGGPNYLLQLADRKNIPALVMHPISDDIVDLEGALLQLGVTEKEKRDFYKAASSMAFWWDNYFTKPRTLRYLVGQDNILSYLPHEEITVLFQDKDSLFDLFLVLAAARTAGCKVHAVASFKQHRKLFRQGPLEKLFLRFGWDYSTMQELPEGSTHIRALSCPPNDLFHEAMDINIPSLHGRLELIHYVREVALSYDYHRYGSLMEREQEWREPVL